MKRKLSVGIALCGGSKLVILDEPSSGMDPSARHEIWDLLESYRNKCSILLSTHFMDEADVLGDRIAIMADGKMRCAGSSSFLKSIFGIGYHVVLTKLEGCQIGVVSNFFRSFIPETVLERQAGSELSYLLPFNATPQFPKVFEELEARMSALGISGFGVNITTMEEVFLSVHNTRSNEDLDRALSEMSQRKSSSIFENIRQSLARSKSDAVSEKFGDKLPRPAASITVASFENEVFDAMVPNPSGGDVQNKTFDDKVLASDDSAMKAITSCKSEATKDSEALPVKACLEYDCGSHLWFRQFYALLVKRILNTRRNLKTTIAQVLIPAVLTAVGAGISRIIPEIPGIVPRDLTLDAYGATDIFYADTGNTTNFRTVYANQFSNMHTVSDIDGSNDMDEFLSRRSDQLGGEFSTSNIISASFSEVNNTPKALAWFNNKGFHSVATSLAYLDQAYIRHVAPQSHSNFQLKVINHPLPRTAQREAEADILDTSAGFVIVTWFSIGYAVLASTFAAFLVRERVSRSSLLQKLTGVTPACFWFSAFLHDFIYCLVPWALTAAIFFAFELTEWTDNLHSCFVLFLLFVWATLPEVYLFSFLFEQPSNATIYALIGNFVFAIASVTGVYVLRLLAKIGEDFQYLADYANTLDWILMFRPIYCLGQGYSNIYVNTKHMDACTGNEMAENHCKMLGVTFDLDIFSLEMQTGIGRFCLLLFIQGLLYFIILFLKEYDLFKNLRMTFKSKKRRVLDGEENEDRDVADERTRINRTDLDTLFHGDRIVFDNLKKEYGDGILQCCKHKHLAVKSLCMGIPQGECFGLLGVNGAGKTTAFKMITGDIAPSLGTVYIDRCDVRTKLRMVQKKLGYCPQYDALIDQMTGAETLRMFARLRGIIEAQIEREVRKLADLLSFTEYLNKQCGTYSGGNKRKLCTAIALMAEPPVVLLDEPSTGMDPGARRSLWDVITSVRENGQSIVFTSHSMEECEALCTRLAIMVNGSMQCIGGPQHLRTRFSQGYNLSVKVESNVESVKEYINTQLPGSFCKEEHGNSLTYNIPTFEFSISKIFELMEKAKQSTDYAIIDYMVAQSTLEQVFLDLVKKQKEDAK